MRFASVVVLFALQGGCGANVVFDEPGGSSAGAGDAGAGGPGAADPGEGGGPISECGDLATDSSNCGRCGHQCLGGACAGGQCQPVILATGFTPTDLAIDRERIFVTSVTGEVYAGEKLGDSLAWFTAGDDQALSIALDDSSVYFGGHGTVWRADKASGQATLLASPGGKPFDLALDAGVLFSDYQAFGNVWYLKDGAPVSIAQEGLAHGFAIHHGVKKYSSLTYFSSAGLVRITLSEPETERTVLLDPQAPGLQSPIFLEQAQTGALLWTQGFPVDLGGGIYRYAFEGDSELVAAIETPIGLAVLGDEAFVTTYGALDDAHDGTIQRVDLLTGAAQVLAEGRTDPIIIVADDVALYWIEPDRSHAVLRLAR